MSAKPRLDLPVDAFVRDVRRLLAAHRALVVTAAPGAGKTTRIPPALVDAGRVLLLQPRRVAARSIARRIASEQGWTLGREVGWHVRSDRRFSAETSLIVATEGVLTARLQVDPLLSDIVTIVIDEFHERSVHADLGLAFAREAWMARADLRVVVMSATLDTGPVSAFLGGCPVLDVPGRLFDVAIDYRPGASLEDAVADELPHVSGALLCFLPGAPEIRRAAGRLAARCPATPVLPLHGSLDAEEQDRALEPSDRPRVILATNLAETTVTVPDVRGIIDGGWHKVARYDVARGIDSLELERISRDAADQRAGRAGRLSPGRAVRLWDARDRLAPHREPEIARVDLTAATLDVLAWGSDPRTFRWFDAPPSEAIRAALALLAALGAADGDGKLTPLGKMLRRFPLHPRLARILLAGRGAPLVARACAVLSERHFLPANAHATVSDLLSMAEDATQLPEHVRRVADELEVTARDVLASQGSQPSLGEDEFRRAVLAGYPDRVARRRASGSDRFLLASGTGARLGRESGVFGAEFIVALDVTRGAATTSPDAVVRMASAIDRDWVVVTHSNTEHVLDREHGLVRAVQTAWHGAIAIRRSPVAVDAEQAARLIAAAWLERGGRAQHEQLVARLHAAGLSAHVGDIGGLVYAAALAAPDLDALDLKGALPAEVRRRLDLDAPIALALPSGRRATLDYQSDSRILASVKLQELFGLAETPRIGPRKVPVTFQLLAPNGRPVQVTSDLGSFWRTGYAEVRRELRARYPKHPWPEDPWTAKPTHRTLRRSRG